MATPTPSRNNARLPRRLAALGLAGGLALGGAGALLIPAVASAASTATAAAGSGVSWIQGALAPLVTDGTLTQAQADSVAGALEAAKPERSGKGGGMGRRGAGLDAAAGAIGITADELRTALRDGQTIADVAGAAGVDVQTVIDSMFTAAETALDQAVTDGKLNQEQADTRKAAATERATAIVNGERRAHPERPADAPADDAAPTS